MVLKAFDTLFNQRDYAAAERFWSPDYIQHSAHIEPGREGLFNLIRGAPSTLKYEPGVIVAEGDFVNHPWTVLWKSFNRAPLQASLSLKNACVRASACCASAGTRALPLPRAKA